MARFLASFLTAVVVGLGWSHFGRPAWTERPTAAADGGRRPDAPDALGCDLPEPFPGPTPATDSRLAVFSATARHDFGHAGGFLVLGAATAATLQVVVPRSLLDGLGGSGPGAVITLGLLAVLLAVCSEADAFVAVHGAEPDVSFRVDLNAPGMILLQFVSPSASVNRFCGPVITLRMTVNRELLPGTQTTVGVDLSHTPLLDQELRPALITAGSGTFTIEPQP